MQALSFEEINVVSGGDDTPTVVVTGQKMTDDEKYAYDMSNANGYWDMAAATIEYEYSQMFGTPYY